MLTGHLLPASKDRTRIYDPAPPVSHACPSCAFNNFKLLSVFARQSSEKCETFPGMYINILYGMLRKHYAIRQQSRRPPSKSLDSKWYHLLLPSRGAESPCDLSGLRLAAAAPGSGRSQHGLNPRRRTRRAPATHPITRQEIAVPRKAYARMDPRFLKKCL